MHSCLTPSQITLNNLKQSINVMSSHKLFQEFKDVFPNELLDGLPLEQDFSLSIDVVPCTKPIVLA